MNSCNCNKPKCEPSKCRTDGFVFRKVVIPAQLGDDVTGKDIPENGAMTNSFVTYEANGAQYIYDSFGVYTKFTGEAEVPVLSVNGKIGRVVLTTSDLENDSDYVTTSYVSEAIGVEASERERDDLALSGRIDTVSSGVAAETLARQNADTALGGRIDGVQNALSAEVTARGNADTALQNSVNSIDTAINKDVITDLYVDPTTSTTVVELDATKTNIKTSTTATSSIPLPVASGTQAGVMNAATYNAIAKNTQDIANIKGEVVAITGLPASPTQAELTTAWLNTSGEPELINGAGIYDVTNEKRWTYYSNDTTWHWLDAHGSVQVNQWTNTAAGIVKGSTSTGQIFAEADGTGSVNGWDTLSGQVATNTSKLATIEQGAQANVQANWTEADSTADSYIQNKPTLATVATTGDYGDLTNKPTIPTVDTTLNNSSNNAISNSAVTTKLEDASFIGSTIGQPSSLAYVGSANIQDGAVTTAKIADLNVTEGKLASNSVTTSKIADGSVTSDKIDYTTMGTLLFSGDATATTISLSQSVDNFRYIVFLVRSATNDSAPKYIKIPTRSTLDLPTYAADRYRFTLAVTFMSANGAIGTDCVQYVASNDGQTLTVKYQGFNYIAANGTPNVSQTTNVHVVKIYGVEY